MAKWSGLKRFYKETSTCDGVDGAYLVALDERIVKTPAGFNLGVPSRSLAEALAKEWQIQGEIIDPSSMPLCKLAATAIDRVRTKRDEVIGITLKIAETDLLCYRAIEPPDLVELQNIEWQPELDWAREELGFDLAVTSGILPIIQPESSLLTLQKILGELDEYKLVGVTNAAAAVGSVVLSLSMFNERLNGDTMFEKSILEESHQMKKWGLDEEAVERHKIIRKDIQDSVHFLELLEK
jgi:chaperone required for assembly of F1-ATPase